MKINFKENGNSLGTRFLGEKMRLKIEAAIQSNEMLVFDFEGVDMVSHSFADECFGKLLFTWKLEDLKQKTTFQNTNPNIKKTIAFVLKERVTQTEVA